MALCRRRQIALAPPERLPTKEWARKYRRFHRKDGAHPGPWESEPHHDEIMDAWDDPGVRRVVVCGPSQVGGKSAVMANCLGRSIHLSPTNAMVVYPTINAAEKWMKSRFEPMVSASPVLRAMVPTRKSRDGDQTIRYRQYPGGQLFANGANAPTDLAAQTVRDVYGDEIDRFEASAGKEGDPIDLAEQRQVDYGPFAKTWLSSTPTIEGYSRIDAAYDTSDQRIRELPCPGCKQFVEIAWGDVKFKDPETGEKRPELAHIECPKCRKPWTEAQRQAAIRRGRWRATAPFTGTAGFRWNAFVCPRADLVAIARRFLDALGNPEQEKTFANTVECRSWRPKADAPPWELLKIRRETWPAHVLPVGVVLLTAGADIQKDRIEARVWGWAPGAECWHIETRVFLGSTARDEVWKNLDALLDETWETQGGVELHLDRLAVDMNAYTEEVYRWAKPYRGNRRVMLVRGDHRQTVVLGMPAQTEVAWNGKKARRGARIWPVGVSKAKEWFYQKLALPMPAEGQPFARGFVHLSTRCADEELRQLTSEELRTGKDKYGRPRGEWHVKPGFRNEGLDCWNYAYAAAIDAGLWRLTERAWSKLREQRGLAPAKAPPAFDLDRFGAGAVPASDVPPGPDPFRVADPAEPPQQPQARRVGGRRTRNVVGPAW